MKDQGYPAPHAVVLALLLVVAGCASKAPAPADRSGQAGAQSAPAVPVAGKDQYVVRKGDTLHSIALDHGLDYRELAAWNNIENPNRILVGQVLRTRPPGAAAAGDAVVVRPVASHAAVEQRSLSVGGDVLKREPKAGKEPYSELALARALAPPKPVEPLSVAKVESKPEVRAEAKAESKPESKATAASDEKPADTRSGSEDVSWSWPASGKVVGTFSEGGNKGIDIGGKAGDAVLAAGAGKVVYSGTGLRGYGKLVIVKHNNTYLTAYAHNQNILVKEGQTVVKGQKIAEMGNTDADQVKLHFEIRRQGKPIDPLKQLPPRG